MPIKKKKEADEKTRKKRNSYYSANLKNRAEKLKINSDGVFLND